MNPNYPHQFRYFEQFKDIQEVLSILHCKTMYCYKKVSLRKFITSEKRKELRSIVNHPGGVSLRRGRQVVFFTVVNPMDNQDGSGETLCDLSFCAAPASFLTRIDSHLCRVFLLHRLRLPLLFSVRACRCGRFLDPFGHHRASCSGFAVESAAARICREGGARVTVNMLVRDMDFPVPNARDARRLEIVADWVPFFGGVQLAVGTSVVSPLHCDGSPHRGAANIDAAVAQHKKETTYPDLIGPKARYPGWRNGRTQV